MKHKGGCGCNGGGRRHRTRKNKAAKKGGSMVGDVVLAGTAYGLYSYFTKKRGGTRMGSGRRLPARKTRKALV